MNAQLERLAAAGIRVVPTEIASHIIVERNGFVAFIERRADTLGNIGAPGLLTEHGFAALIWRAGQAFFIARNLELAASDQQVEELRAFTKDLEQALSRAD